MKAAARSIKKLALMGSLALVAASGMAHASDPGDDAIEYRQAIFTAYKWNFAVMGAMMRGKMDYDAAEFQRRAVNLAAIAPMAKEGFIEGSELGDTRALPELWENMEDVSQRFDEFVVKTQELADASGGDMDSVKAAFGAVGKSCKGCHDDYREE